jgi:hypothetical protein
MSLSHKLLDPGYTGGAPGDSLLHQLDVIAAVGGLQPHLHLSPGQQHNPVVPQLAEDGQRLQHAPRAGQASHIRKRSLALLNEILASAKHNPNQALLVVCQNHAL